VRKLGFELVGFGGVIWDDLVVFVVGRQLGWQ
jgi:hypothetical protein